MALFDLFRGSRKARQGDDQVWATGAARKAGLLRETERLAAGGASVLVVGLNAFAVDELVGSLERHAPAVCRDLFGQGALRLRLSRPGTISVALASALPTVPRATAGAEAAAPPSSTPVEILVCGRHDRRDADDTVVAFADALGPQTRVSFHLSFDDPLLQHHGGRVKELLERFGMTEDQPISHALVTRSVEKAQRKG